MNNHAEKITVNHRSTSANPKQIKSSPYKMIVIIVGIVALLLLSAILTLMFLTGDKPKTDRYQAVFLDNNQVFFGKLKNTTGKYLTLEEAYYTKAAELPADATAEQKAATENNVSLVKVGSEVYGPENVLKIRSEQVLFWQNLSADSKVAKAIKAQQ